MVYNSLFKGTRFRRQNLETDLTDGNDVEPFFTPAALLQDRADSVKYLDLSKATESQRKSIAASRAQTGELLVTRSGTIGRVIYVTKQLAGRLISDDLIHIRIENEVLRYYVYLMLKHTLGQHQMLRNEYGSVQVHLEPSHVRDVIVPIPENPAMLQGVADSQRKSIEAKELSWNMEEQAQNLLGQLVVLGDEMEDSDDGVTKEQFERLLTKAAQPADKKKPAPSTEKTSE